MEQTQWNSIHAQRDMGHQNLSDEIVVLECPGNCVKMFKNLKAIASKENIILRWRPPSSKPTLRHDVSTTAANTISIPNSMDLAIGSSEHVRKELANSCSTRTENASNNNR